MTRDGTDGKEHGVGRKEKKEHTIRTACRFLKRVIVFGRASHLSRRMCGQSLHVM